MLTERMIPAGEEIFPQAEALTDTYPFLKTDEAIPYRAAC